MVRYHGRWRFFQSLPLAGTLLTSVQFLFVASTGYVSQFDLRRPPLFLKPNRVPIRRWLINITLFFTINVLNNHAFSYNISVPIHIILRSGGSITTILAGYLFGKRYSRLQVTSVILLTIGVIIAAWSDAQAKVSCSINVREALLKFHRRKLPMKNRAFLVSVWVLSFCSLPKYSPPSWACTPRTLIGNTDPTGKRICFTRTFSPYPYSCPSCLL